MPTIPKVVAALFFAALAYFCGDLIKPLLPEGTRTVWFNEILAATGVVSGWLMSGANAGHGTRSGFGYGLTTAALIVFWAAFIFAGTEMLQQSMDRRFNGPMQAIKSMVRFMIDNWRLIATPEIIGTIVVGGLFGGWVTEWAAKRWQ